MERQGIAVTVVTRAPPPIGGDSIVWSYGDVSSNAARAAVEGTDCVVYAAGSLGPATTLATVHGAITEEILPVVQIAERAARAGTKTFVFISSGGTVYGPAAPIPTTEDASTAPINIYGSVKVLTEMALLEVGRKYGITVVILRISNPYGPGQSGTRRLGFIAAAIKASLTRQPIVIWGDGSATRNFVFIDDVGAALAAAACYRGSSAVLNIGSGQEMSLIDVCNIVSSTGSAPLEIRFDMGRAFDVPRSCLNIDRAAAVLGWQPEISIEEGIARTMSKFL